LVLTLPNGLKQAITVPVGPGSRNPDAWFAVDEISQKALREAKPERCWVRLIRVQNIVCARQMDRLIGCQIMHG
jgi:hypothetical protein